MLEEKMPEVKMLKIEEELKETRVRKA